jgi:hypothetical protein
MSFPQDCCSEVLFILYWLLDGKRIYCRLCNVTKCNQPVPDLPV